MDSEIGGVNTTVAKIEAQLADAKWELEQTTVRAPADGAVTLLALTVGDRALQARAVMSFIITDEVMLIGMFSPNAFETVKPGAVVKLVFDDRPGRIYNAKIVEIPLGVGQGQVAVSGTLARSGSITGAKAFPRGFPFRMISTKHNSALECRAPRRHSRRRQALSEY